MNGHRLKFHGLGFSRASGDAEFASMPAAQHVSRRRLCCDVLKASIVRGTRAAAALRFSSLRQTVERERKERLAQLQKSRPTKSSLQCAAQK